MRLLQGAGGGNALSLLRDHPTAGEYRGWVLRRPGADLALTCAGPGQLVAFQRGFSRSSTPGKRQGPESEMSFQPGKSSRGGGADDHERSVGGPPTRAAIGPQDVDGDDK